MALATEYTELVTRTVLEIQHDNGAWYEVLAGDALLVGIVYRDLVAEGVRVRMTSGEEEL